MLEYMRRKEHVKVTTHRIQGRVHVYSEFIPGEVGPRNGDLKRLNMKSSIQYLNRPGFSGGSVL